MKIGDYYRDRKPHPGGVRIFVIIDREWRKPDIGKGGVWVVGRWYHTGKIARFRPSLFSDDQIGTKGDGVRFVAVKPSNTTSLPAPLSSVKS